MPEPCIITTPFVRTRRPSFRELAGMMHQYGVKPEIEVFDQIQENPGRGETEASVVRLKFQLATGVQGRPLGVKAIATHRNVRGIHRRRRQFSTGGVHDILTSTT